MNITITKEFLETQNKNQINKLAEQSNLSLEIDSDATKDQLIEAFLEASANKSKNKIWDPKRGIGKAVKDFMDSEGNEKSLTPEKVREIATSLNDNWEITDPETGLVDEEKTEKKAKTHCAWYQSQYRKLNGTAKTRSAAPAEESETDDVNETEEIAEVV